MADDEGRDDRIIAALAEQLRQSRQQQDRLRDALTRVLALVEQEERTA